MTFPECEECRAIIAEYVAAGQQLAQEMRESRLGRDKEFAEAWHQARRLQTEDDVALAEELFPTIQLPSSARIRDIRGRMSLHSLRTGHKALQVFDQK
jgi:hypothetical protein